MTIKLKLNNDKQLNSSSLVPYLGDIWAHFPNLRILLAWNSGRRYIHINKSAEIMTYHIPYKITVFIKSFIQYVNFFLITVCKLYRIPLQRGNAHKIAYGFIV